MPENDQIIDGKDGVLCHSGVVVLWWCVVVVNWFCGGVVYWCSGSVVLWCVCSSGARISNGRGCHKIHITEKQHLLKQ